MCKNAIAEHISIQMSTLKFRNSCQWLTILVSSYKYLTYNFIKLADGRQDADGNKLLT